MKKLLPIFILSTIISTANAAVTHIPMMTAAVVAASSAANISNQNTIRREQEYKSQNPMYSLIGKRIDNCLIINAFWDSYNDDFYVVCLNTEKDQIYSKAIYNPEKPFQKKVYDELRKSFQNTENNTVEKESDKAE